MSVKAFESVPVIETSHLLFDGKSSTKIECIECCGRELFVGSSEGCVQVYFLEEKHVSNGKLVYSSKKTQEHQLNVKKPIKSIKAASALNRLLVLCNSSLYMLDMVTLEIIGGSPQLQGITTFCVNENPNVDDPFSTQICVAERKKLKIINVNDKKFNLVTDISVPEPAREVAVDGPFICVALLKQYKVFNFETKSSQDLFDIASDTFIPVIRRITKGEFLLTAPEGLGMFVTAQGIPSRPPIQWSCQYSLDPSNNPGVLSLAYFHPYILGLSSELLMIHSVLDQKQKQSIPFNGGLTIGNFDGRLYMNSNSSVCCLCPVPWENQVQTLLADKRVDEALELANNVNHSGSTKDQYDRLYQNIHKQAAFIYFSMEEFDKAKDLFMKSQIDIREVISLFPKMLPKSNNFTRAVPPLHDIADIDQLFHRNETKSNQAHQFLRHLLEELHDTSPRLAHQFEVDTALIKLYSQSNRSDLEAFIVAGEINCDVQDCLEWLENHGCYHALALIHRHSRNHELAIQVWARIIAGELQDDSFQGLQFFVECLANLKDLDLMWRYTDFVLQKDETLGAQIFTKRPAEENFCDRMNPDYIVEFLQKYPQALVDYLEYLVLNQKIMKEKFHTHLAVLYLEKLIKMRREKVDESLIMEARNKFQHLLQESNMYRVQLLLGKIKGSGLDREAATLYGKVGEHDKALDILVHRLRDYKAAEEYCISNQSKDKKSNNSLFHILLGCYLNPKLESEQKEELIGPALELLNRQAFAFDSAKVLEILPPEWSITVVGSFLRGALRASLHKYRLSKVESALARGENLQRRFALYDLQHNSVLVQESNYCCVCKKPFIDGSFARYPNNVITHVACARQNDVCPLTGKVFRAAFPAR